MVRKDGRLPYISEFEDEALKVLRGKGDNKERLRELLESYATRYADEYKSRS